MIKQAIILAAGLGKRLRPLTTECPKPMLTIGNKSILEHHLDKLAKADVKHVVIHVSYMADYIINNLPKGHHWGLDIQFAKSTHLLGTGGGIKCSQDLLADQSQPFLCINGDIYTEYNYQEIISLLFTHNVLIDGLTHYGHMVLVPNPAENPNGDFDVKPDIRTGRMLLSKTSNQQHDYTFTGISVYHPNIFKLARNKKHPDHKDHKEYSIIEHINHNEDKFTATVYDGMWYDLGTIDRYNYVNNIVRQQNASLG